MLSLITGAILYTFLKYLINEHMSNPTWQRPTWQANSCSAIRKISYLLRNPNVHYHIHKRSPLVPILNQMKSAPSNPIYWRSILIYNYVCKVTSYIPVSQSSFVIYMITLSTRFLAQQPNLGLDHLTVEVSRSHTIRQTHYTRQDSSEQVIRSSQKLMHDHPPYLCCRDVLSMLGDPLSGNGCGSLNHI